MKIKALEKEGEEKQEQKAKIQSESSDDRSHTELQKYFFCGRCSDLSSECNKFSSAQSNAEDLLIFSPLSTSYICIW